MNYNEIKEYIVQLNDFIKKETKGNNHYRNFIYYITNNLPGNISIKGNFVNNNEYEYFGVSPKYSVSDVKSLILSKNSCFDSEELFIKFLKDKTVKFWTIGENNEELNQALFGRSILSTSCEFYFEFKINITSKTITDIKKELSSINILSDLDDEGQKLKLFGRPTLKQLKCLSELYSIYFEKDELFITDKYTKHKDKAQEWYNLYTINNEKNLKCKSQAFYSGVVPRLKKINLIEPSEANSNISRIEVDFERTTFITMLGIGRLNFNNTELLEKYSNLLNEFDNKEAKLQKEFFAELSEKKDNENVEIILNTYLEKSKYTHNMNISGNIITSDNYCVYTKRNKNTTDPGNFYCSVNGGCEIYDENVDFYYNSVDEDLPSIRLNNAYEKEKFSFGGELTRETCAELGLTEISNNWKYYGLSIMGRNYNENENYLLSLHFNILGYKYVNNSLETLRNFQIKSTEKFENESLYGYKIEMYKNTLDKTINAFINISKMLQNWKDVLLILAIMIQALFANSLFRFKFKNLFSIENMLNILINLALLIILFNNLIMKYKSRKFKKSISVKVTDLSNKGNKKFELYKKLIKNEENRADPIFILLFNLLVVSYFDEKCS